MAGDICPWWMGYLLANPIRRLLEKPERIIGPHISEGDTVLDFGPAMGFFTLPAAREVGSSGRVIAVDIQEKMLRALKRKLARAGLAERVETRLSSEHDLALGGLDGQIDLAMAIHVVHEVPDPRGLFEGLYTVIKPGGRLLVIEPPGHVKAEDFAETVRLASEVGFAADDSVALKQKRAALFVKPA